MATEKIPKGTVLWLKEAAVGDYIENLEELEEYIKEKNMGEAEIKHMIIHAYGETGKLFNLFDDS